MKDDYSLLFVPIAACVDIGVKIYFIYAAMHFINKFW